MKLEPAMKAFVVYNDRVLILRESFYYESPNKGKWDVPGGRIKPGENIDEALLREIYEESSLRPKLGNPFSIKEWHPIIIGIEHQIVGTFRECFADSDKVMLSGDHDIYEWIKPEDYRNYDLVGVLPQVFRDYLNR